ncbi:BEL1-like homeodomain protein 1 [Neltuma alba]|uniref:BEL1-like homeodomain protein 1 n=1 Tax=Neltuma alba TaxID=207710 RepID=UPI0010A3BDA5|nr:BEL1-like homeodomain protein 1 [Prosopis alba]
MATFFHGGSSEIQSSGASAAAAAGDGFHTLYLLNPSTTTPYAPYSDTSPHPQPTPNMLLLNPNNSPPNALNLATLSHAPPPSSSDHNPDDPTRPSFLGHEISAFHGFTPSATPPRVHYNLWGSMIDPHPTSAVATASSSSGGAPSASASATLDVSPHMSFRRPTQQGLSLSLSSQQTAYRSLSGELDVPGQPHQASAIPTSSCDEVMRILVPSNHASSNGISSVQSFVLGSKYLRAAQEVLDEVVNVGNKGISQEGAMKEKMKANKESTSGGNRDVSSGGDGGGGGEENSGNGKQGGELSTAQRQELQMKKSKLVTILDEVEQRYRQYHHQMQIVIASFEQAAGYGAAKTYTSLALKTISKQFRCLKDAIASQIRATSKTLGEDDCLGAKVEGSRLRFVDHHLRQQRALQQLGMMQHNAWRPQRGLPERAVSILRAWLFEHFLHPYPKDSDKVMLAKQTGLSRSQVSNWFINARVRLWKPMVEEMYVEEMKEQGGNNKEVGSSSKDNNPQPQDPGGLRLDHHHHQMKGFQSNPDHQSLNNQTTTPTDISNSSIYQLHPPHHSSGFAVAAGSIRTSPKKPRSSEVMNNSPSSIVSVDIEMKPGDTGRSEGNAKFPLMSNNGSDGGGYGGFTMEEMGRYNVADQLAPRFHGNGVSLTLGLPHSTDNLSHHGFLSHNMNLTTDGTDFCEMNAPPSHSNPSYENMDHIQNRKRFAAQLLPDFVAL